MLTNRMVIRVPQQIISTFFGVSILSNIYFFSFIGYNHLPVFLNDSVKYFIVRGSLVNSTIKTKANTTTTINIIIIYFTLLSLEAFFVRKFCICLFQLPYLVKTYLHQQETLPTSLAYMNIFHSKN